MSSKRIKRITNEIKELENSSKILEDSGIYYYYNEDNINFIYAMLYGPEKTPYEKGFYFFSFEYPASYPMEPPMAKYYTQGFLRNPHSNTPFNIRFNPNLYCCGKVCLSMLNTWSGPGWVPTNTISNVLVAIQALVLNEEPLRNEPGFEFSPKPTIDKYSQLIEYANISIGVLEMIENTPKKFEYFKPIMEELFLKNIDFYKNTVLTKNDKYKGKALESPAYGMKCNLDYQTLIYDVCKMEESLIMKIASKSLENLTINDNKEDNKQDNNEKINTLEIKDEIKDKSKNKKSK
jgi:ubiquitin-protein ligase